jgi:hypothetical protein
MDRHRLETRIHLVDCIPASVIAMDLQPERHGVAVLQKTQVLVLIEWMIGKLGHPLSPVFEQLVAFERFRHARQPRRATADGRLGTKSSERPPTDRQRRTLELRVPWVQSGGSERLRCRTAFLDVPPRLGDRAP